MPCQQKVQQPSCNGPYSETPCKACESLEGKCQRGKPLPPDKCRGPFDTVKCSLCKNLEEGLYNPKHRGYVSSLNLDTVKLQHVFPKDSPVTPARIDYKYKQAKNPLIPCPWVEVGNLYMSVTVTGEGSWGQLIDKLYKLGRRKFAVFTGRHGLEVGTVVQDLDSKQLGPSIPDENHVEQDFRQKPLVEGRHSVKKSGPITITLWNVGTTPDTTMSKTKRLACERLNEQGTVVIFAWCYSLLSCYQVSLEQEERMKSHSEIACYNTPIRTIAAEKYGWADVLHLRNLKILKPRSGSDVRHYVKWRQQVKV